MNFKALVLVVLLSAGVACAHDGGHHGGHHRPRPRPAAPKVPKSVAQLVIDNKDKGFGILLQAVLAADKAVLDTLSDPNLKATVFAPTDAAFAHLLKRLNTTAEALLANKPLLNAVLQYHVIGGSAVRANSIPRAPGLTVQTLLDGKNGKFTIRRGGEGRVRIVTSSGGQSTVVTADLRAGKKAIVHAVDRVLVPKV